MITKYLDEDLENQGVANPALRLFIQRWAELFHWRTIDSYRVKFLNAFRSLQEVLDVCEALLAGSISAAHLVPTAEEAATLLDKDPVLRARQRALVGQTIANLHKKREGRFDYLRLKAQVRHCLDRLRGRYLDWLLDDLQSSVNVGDLASVDLIASALASELVWQGYSEHFLYRLAGRLVREVERGGESALWDRLRQVCSASTQAYSCCFPVTVAPESVHGDYPRLSTARSVG